MERFSDLVARGAQAPVDLEWELSDRARDERNRAKHGRMPERRLVCHRRPARRRLAAPGLEEPGRRRRQAGAPLTEDSIEEAHVTHTPQT